MPAPGLVQQRSTQQGHGLDLCPHVLARHDIELVSGEARDARKHGRAGDVEAHQDMGWGISVGHLGDGDRQQVDDRAAVESFQRETDIARMDAKTQATPDRLRA